MKQIKVHSDRISIMLTFFFILIFLKHTNNNKPGNYLLIEY